MAKKNSDETIPMQPKKTADVAQPISGKENIGEQTVPTPVKRKSRKKQELDTTIPQEPVIQTIQPEPVIEEPTKRVKRGGWIWLGILGMLIITAIGAAIGYGSAIQVRKAEETNQRLIISTTQYELGLLDIKNGDLSMAKRRLEYVIEIYPNYPGAADKLSKVMVKLAQANQNSTVTVSTPVVEATKDTRGTAAIFATAKQQLASEDWQGLYSSVLSLRDLDPTYEAIKVDGMYYMALRNMGINNIKNGNLEIGIFQFSVAERIGPIDSEANNWRQLAKYYVDGGSGWGVTWNTVLQNFALLYQNAPYLADSNGVTSTQRYAQALAGYGDTLQTLGDYCGSVTQYEASLGIQSSQSVIDKIPQAKDFCANPPATPTPTIDPNMTPTPTNGS